MTIDFKKKVSQMTEAERNYHKLEVQRAADSIVRQHSNKDGEFLLLLSIALRDRAGSMLYGNDTNKDNEDDE